MYFLRALWLTTTLYADDLCLFSHSLSLFFLFHHERTFMSSRQTENFLALFVSRSLKRRKEQRSKSERIRMRRLFIPIILKSFLCVCAVFSSSSSSSFLCFPSYFLSLVAIAAFNCKHVLKATAIILLLITTPNEKLLFFRLFFIKKKLKSVEEEFIAFYPSCYFSC